MVKILGYIGFSLMSLLVSLYMTFPGAAVGQRIAHEVRQATQGSVALSFEDLELYRLTGISAEGVQVELRRGAQDTQTFALDEATVRLQILSLLMLEPVVSADLKLGDGSIEAEIGQPEEGEYEVKVDIAEVGLASAPMLAEMVGLPMSGVVTGNVETAIKKDPRKNEGQLSLQIAGSSVGPGSVGGLTLPKMNLGNLELQVNVDKGRIEISEFKQAGGDIEARLSGHSNLRSSLLSSSVDACVQFKADAGFLAKNPKMKTIMDLAKIKLKKGESDFLHLPLSGTFSRPRLRGGLCRKQRTR